MGVYLPNMEMPESCYYCPFRQGSFGKVPIHRAMCMVTGEVMPVDGENIQHNQPCPLVYVPPHGRLIDADALIADTSFFDGGDWHYGYSSKQITKAPAIIPAEPCKEKGE